MIRIAAADDHVLFVEGLTNALSAIPDMAVVATASDVPGIMAALQSHGVGVLLLDFEMPGGGGRAVLAETKGRVPTIIVTMHSEPSLANELMAAGASAVLPKSIPLRNLAAAIRAVASGEILRGSQAEIESILIDHMNPVLDPGAESLTDRERELLALLAAGVSRTEELAERLYISPKTVKNHLASIFDKLAVSDRTQAAIEAIRLGLGGGPNDQK